MKTARFLAVLTALTGALLPASAMAQGGGAPASGKAGVGDYIKNRDQQNVKLTINVDLEDADLREAMERIGRRVGKNILVDPTVNERVTLSLYDIPWRDAVDVIARMTKCEVEERGAVLILTQPPKVTIQFTDANIRVVLQLLAAYSGKNIIIHPAVTGLVTLDLKEVRWDKALRAIVKTVGPYEVVEDGPDLIRVVPESTIQTQLKTVAIPLKYVRPPVSYRAQPTGATGQSGVLFQRTAPAPAQNLRDSFTLYQALDGVVRANANTAPGSVIQYDQRTNAFVVTATEILINQIRSIIDKIDTEPSQIYVEIRFVSTQDDNFQENGIAFNGTDPNTGLTLNGPFPSNTNATLTPGTSAVDGGRAIRSTANAAFTSQDPLTGLITTTTTPRPVGTFPFMFGGSRDVFEHFFQVPGFLDFRGLQMTMNLIDSDTRSRVVQAPSLYMLDNEDAVIFVGENVPYAEVSNTSDIGGNVTQSIRAGAQSPIQIGFSLFISPHVVPDSDRIMLTVIPRVNSLAGAGSPIKGFDRFTIGTQVIDLPHTREQALVTHIMVDDGQTAVLGGLLSETDIEVIKKVPIISNIPILGNLFTNKRKTKDVENLVIFITPTLVRSRAQATALFKKADQQLKSRDYFYRTFEKPENEVIEAKPAGADPGTGLDQQTPSTAPSEPGANKLDVGKPADQKPADQKPADQKPADQKPADQPPSTAPAPDAPKPADQPPAAEPKPAEPKPAEPAPATPAEPAPATPAEPKPAEPKPAEPPAAGPAPAEPKPAEPAPAPAPAEPKPAEPAPAPAPADAPKADAPKPAEPLPGMGDAPK